jgi:hypothetical protein
MDTLSYRQDRKVPAEESNSTKNEADDGSGDEPPSSGKSGISGEAGKSQAIAPAGGKAPVPVPDRAAPRQVERATALRGQSIAPSRTPKSALRRRTLQDLRERDPEVPYRQYEAASRDLICSLMERQDRMNEAIFNRIIDLEYRMNELEDEPAPVRTGRKNNGPEG